MSRTLHSGRAEDELPFMQMSEMLDALRWHGLLPDTSMPTQGINSLALSQRAGADLTSIVALRSSLASPEVIASYESEILPIAKSLFPESALETSEPMTVGKLSRVHLRLLIYALSNDFAGLRAHIPLNMVHEYIKDAMTTWLDQAACLPFRSSSILTMAPLAEGFFTCAIEAGDVNAVARLLSTPGPGLDVNAHFCNVGGVQHTAIERSAELQHLALTQLLLQAGAEVNKTLGGLTSSSDRPHSGLWPGNPMLYSRSSPSSLPKPRGALECAIRGYSKDSQLGRDLVLMLSGAGGAVGFQTMSLMLDSGEDDILEIVLRAGLATSYESWSYSGFFFRFAQKAHAPLIKLVLHELIKSGVDLDGALVSQEGDNHVGTCCLWEEVGWPPYWIDVMAQRGEEDLVRLLIEIGTRLTPNVLVAATISRHGCLIEHLLRAGALPETFSRHYRTTALAEAVRSQEMRIIQLMDLQLDINVPMANDQWCALLAAFAEVGENTMLSCLIRQEHYGHTDRSSILGYALIMAARTGNERGATLLLEAGAATYFDNICSAMRNPDCTGHRHHSYGRAAELSPLVLALKCRNVALVNQLLDHDSPFEGCIDATLAWGDTNITKSLIACGVRHRGVLGNTILTATIAHPQCILLLLQAGVVSPRWSLCRIIGLGDMALVKECLEYCSVTVDGDALAYALETSTEVFRIVLDAVPLRDPQGLGILGQHALEVAVGRSQHGVVEILLGLGTARVPYDWLPDAFNMYHGGKNGSALLTAISRRDTRMMKMLLSARPAAANEVVGPRRHRKTPLLASLDTYDASVVLVVLQHDADINFPATRGIKRTPLQRAVGLGSYDMVDLLLRRGADVNATPAARGGATALQLAACNGHIGIAQLLLRHGANITAAGSLVDGQTAIECAAEHGRFDMVVFLLRTAQHQKPHMLSAKNYAQTGGYNAIVEVLEDAIDDMVSDTSGLPLGLPDDPYIDDGTAADNELLDLEEDSDEDAEADQSTHQSGFSQQRHTCPICSTSLSNASALRRHERNVHKDVFQGPQWTCGMCAQSFGRKDTLKRHEATHDKVGYKDCSRCGGSFRPDYFGTHGIACQD